MKKTFFLLIFIAGIADQSFCQKQGQEKIDSLFTVLKTAKEDTTKVKTLNALSYEFSSNNPDTAIYFANEALALATKLNYEMGIAIAHNAIGTGLMNNGKYQEALKNYNDALKIFDELLTSAETTLKSKILKGKGNSYNGIGNIYLYQGNYPDALRNYFTSLKIREDIGDKNGIAASYANIGIIYFSIGNYPEALKYYFTALKIDEELGSKRDEANSLSNIGGVYVEQGNDAEALKHYFAALKLNEEFGNKRWKSANLSNIGLIYSNQGNYAEALKNYFAALILSEELGDKQGKVEIISNIGVIYERKGNYAEALKNYFAALKIGEEIGDKKTIANIYTNIGEHYLKIKKPSEASPYLFKGLSLAKEIGALEQIRESYLGLAELDSAQANFKQSLKDYKMYITYRDSLVNEEKTKKMTQLQMQNDFDKKQVADSLKFEKEKEVGIILLQRQKVITYSGFAGVALTLLFLFFMYRSFRKQKRSNHIIELTNQELHKVNNELKETQAQLVQQEKLASLGALTAGVAHEIKNPLNFVNNFAELSNELLEELKTAGSEEEKNEIMKTLKQNLEKINHHGKRADGIVKSMLEHSRSGTGEKQPTDINRLCDEYLNLAYHGMRAAVKDFNCTMERHFAENLPKLNIVPQDISRVLLNLINNAFYAIKDKPNATLTITTLATPHSVIIKIKDNGTGIPEDVKQKIFEPFFTTKPAGSGTGLGLSLSFDIIKTHGGKIEVDSKENEYTEFIITIPL